MNNSQKRRALLPLYLQSRRILILHVTRVLMYTSTVTAKEFIDIDIDISGFGRNSDSDMGTLRNCDMETFEIQTGDIKNPLTGPLYPVQSAAHALYLVEPCDSGPSKSTQTLPVLSVCETTCFYHQN